MNNNEKNKLIFILSNEDKVIANDCCHEVINVILKHTKNNLGMKAYIMNVLIDTFKETYNVDLRNESTLRSITKED